MQDSLKGRPTVLIAEDCADVALMMKSFLENAGYEVSIAGTIAEAIEIDRSASIGLVVSDFRLPDGTAWDLVRKLSTIRPVPGIVISGYADQIYKDMSKKAGFSEYLVKPVEQDDLVAAIDRVLANQQA